ncbi:MAG: hypothetical protein HKN44_15465 [Ilumatobacter sp.]|nr:hypothetical protein [Ilumatobacter sp.]
MSDDHDFSVDGAQAAADRDELAAWVAAFLESPGSDNAALGKQLREEVTEWTGPVRLPFDDLHRLAGPPDQPTLERLGDDDLETVEGMEESIEEGWEPPPLIVTFQHDHLVVEDGNHRTEGLRRAGHDGYWSVIGFEQALDREKFEAEFAR